MSPPIYNQIIEFGDGTPATQSQIAKDVATFLVWGASPEHDMRKKMAIKATVIFSILLGSSYYMKIKEMRENLIKFTENYLK